MIQRRWFARLRYGAAALLFFLCFWLTPMQTEAATDGMLTIICKDGDTILPNLTWKLYRVGSYSSSGELLLEGDFADYPVNGKLTTTAEVQDAADTLANLTVVDAIAPLSTGKTDQSGAVTFAPLETGAYLITGKPVVVGDKRYIPAPALLYLTEESGSDTFQWNIYPKFTVKPFSTSSTVRYSVEKVWLHDEGMTMNCPEDLVIQLYCDDVMREEVTLNEANGWSYSWEGNSLEEWHVKELVVPKNYLVVYKQNDTQFLIFNSHNQTGSQELTTAPITTTTTTETTTVTTETILSETETTILETTTSVGSSIVSGGTAIVSTTETGTATTTSGSGTTSTGSSGSTTSGSGTGTTVTTTKPTLPATGQLWWPVPCLAAGGLVLLGVGWRMDKKED